MKHFWANVNKKHSSTVPLFTRSFMRSRGFLLVQFFFKLGVRTFHPTDLSPKDFSPQYIQDQIDLMLEKFHPMDISTHFWIDLIKIITKFNWKKLILDSAPTYHSFYWINKKILPLARHFGAFSLEYCILHLILFRVLLIVSNCSPYIIIKAPIKATFQIGVKCPWCKLSLRWNVLGWLSWGQGWNVVTF